MGKAPTSIKTRLILEQDGKLLFLKQTKHNGGAYTLIGGKADKGETAKEALIRESWEEAGLILRKENLSLVHIMHRIKNDRSGAILFFHASSWSGKIIARERHKFKDLEWISKLHLPSNLKPHIKTAIQHYERGMPYSELREELISQNLLSYSK